MKHIFILLVLLSLFNNNSEAQALKPGQAKGMFLAVGVGPRLPIGKETKNQSIGPAVNFELSYTDNKVYPFFIYTSVGFQHNPGNIDYYKKSDYNAFSSNLLYAHTGLRFFLPPILEEMVIMMPIVDVGASFGYFEKIHRFKPGSGVSNFTEDTYYTGFHAGIGVSMFIMDVIASYNYYHNNQHLGIDLKIRIPLYITF